MSDELYSKYGPLVDSLAKAFGVTFELWETGGGCTALIGEFEDDASVYITDSPDTVHGHEACITDLPTRQRLGESNFGFAIGAYFDHCDQLWYEEYPTATSEQLPDLVREVLEKQQAKRRDRGEW